VRYLGGLAVHEIHRALAFIDSHLDDDLTLPHLAETLCVSPHHFAHVFRQAIGVAPHQYVIRRRVERAKELLDTTAMPIVEIALAVGCANQSHFSALFHRVAGLTPHAYRAAQKAKR
jgi:AraC family transcriptional regulator